MSHKLNDTVIARIAQIVQEGMILGIDVVDLMRQIEVEPAGDGETLTLTPAYVASIKQMHEKLLAEAQEHQQARQGSSVIFKS
jgi:hypothetical protein